MKKFLKAKNILLEDLSAEETNREAIFREIETIEDLYYQQQIVDQEIAALIH